MRRGRVMLLVVGASLLVALGLTVRLALAGERATAGNSGAVAVVLLPRLDGSAFAVVDLHSGRLVRTVRLRSLVTDIAADRGTGLVVGAQSGGVGAAADDAASLVDPRSGAVRYVKLPWPDPARVACIAGRAFLLHSVVDTAGLAVSVVGVRSGSVVATGHVPDGSGAWVAAGGSVWSLALTAGPDPFAVVRVGAGTLAPTVRALDGIAPSGLSEADGALLVLGRERGTGPGGSSLVAVLDRESGSARVSRPLAGLAHPPSQALVVGGRLIVGDWNGEAPEARSLHSLDASTLASVGTIEIDGVPCALGSWEGRLLVVDREHGRLLQVDPDSGETLSATDLGARNLAYSRVAVLPGR